LLDSTPVPISVQGEQRTIFINLIEPKGGTNVENEPYPATGKEIPQYTTMNKDQVFQLVNKAKRSFPEWRKDYEQRRSYIYNLVEYLKKNKTKLAKSCNNRSG